MRSLLKPALVFSLILGVCIFATAQVKLKKPDVIQKIDKTSLEVVIDEINKTDILYRKANDPKGPLYAMPKKEVRKIIWNNGDVEDITLAPVVSQQSVQPVPAKTEKAPASLLFWDKTGLFAGLRVGAGVGITATSNTTSLSSGSRFAYNVGATLGFRAKAIGVQVDALYTGASYTLRVPGTMQGVKSVNGQQNNLVIPVMATFYTKISKTRLGISAGGFASMQAGPGSTKITSSENKISNVKNCSTCTGEAIFGIVGGLSATVVERANHSIFIDARYYHSLGDNTGYKIAETGVKLNVGAIGAGVLFNLSR